MKKTISTIAILAATSSASAFWAGPMPVRENVCLKTYKAADRSLQAGSCNESSNNAEAGLALKENGCAKGQIALNVEVGTIESCLPAGVVQL